MSRKKRIYKGVNPTGDGWFQKNTFLDKDNKVWSFWLKDDHNGFIQIKLVKNEPSKIKANYRLCFIQSESRLVRNHENEMLIKNNPELIEPMLWEMKCNFDSEAHQC